MSSPLLRELEEKEKAYSRARFQLSKRVLCEVDHVREFAYLEILVPESSVEKSRRMIKEVQSNPRSESELGLNGDI